MDNGMDKNMDGIYIPEITKLNHPNILMNSLLFPDMGIQIGTKE